MPAYSFQKQFVPLVESGAKTHTIRGKRKARPHSGQPFYGYYGMRTKQCRKLFESVITTVEDITIEFDHWVNDYVAGEHICWPYPKMTVGESVLADDEMFAVAVRDGFPDLMHMMFFWPIERLPFHGDIIHWRLPRKQS